MSNARVWLFRVLVAAAAGFMVATWFLPWWAAYAEGLTANVVIIHPWGLETHLGGFDILIKGAAMPGWFAPLAWAYLGLCIIALLYGSWVLGKEVSIGRFRIKLSKLLIGGVGLSYIVIAVIAVIFAAIRTGDFYGLPLQGSIYLDLGDPVQSDVDTSLLFGYYLSHGAGLLCIVLALLRDKITGKIR